MLFLLSSFFFAQTCLQCEENIQAATDAQHRLRDKEQELAKERRLLSDAQRQLLDKEQELEEERRLLFDAQCLLQDNTIQLEEER